MTENELLRNAGLTPEQWHSLRGGNVDEATLERLAHPLRLDGQALIRVARGEYAPDGREIPGLRRFASTFSMGGDELSVNSYLVWDPQDKQAAVFDTGTDAGPMLEVIRSEGLNVEHIFLTHTHPDHVKALDPLLEGLDAAPPIHVHSSERESGMLSIESDSQMHLGALVIQTRLTSGHSPGGMTYIVQGLESLVAIVGDALFAGSAGGARTNWRTALAAILEQIFTLPDKTIVCPGHGPLTTVGYERANNPLFPSLR